MPKPTEHATATQLKEIRRHAVNDVTREIMSNGIKLTWEQANDLGDATLDWMRKRLGLKSTTNDRGITFKPEAPTRAHATIGTQKIPSFKISTKDPAALTAGEINKELDKLNAQDSTLGDLMIEAGRGHERPSEYLQMTDPLAMELRKNADRRQDLRIEISQRYGPNPPSRLPTGRGFGPRSKPSTPTHGGIGFGKRYGGD